jgi:DNA-binding transcriptional ArsR family regulator
MSHAAHTPGTRRGRPPAAVNLLELSAWWEGRGGRRPLPQRELARKLGLAEATIRKHLRALRTAGQLDDQARARNLATRGALRRGGRPPRPLKDIDLIVAWAQRPTVTAVACTLHVSRACVRERLQGLGLLSERPQSERRKAPWSETDAD